MLDRLQLAEDVKSVLSGNSPKYVVDVLTIKIVDAVVRGYIKTCVQHGEVVKITGYKFGPVAQLEEHGISNPTVGGSSPSGTAILKE